MPEQDASSWVPTESGTLAAATAGTASAIAATTGTASRPNIVWIFARPWRPGVWLQIAPRAFLDPAVWKRRFSSCDVLRRRWRADAWAWTPPGRPRPTGGRLANLLPGERQGCHGRPQRLRHTLSVAR